jgi:hypothetical protein
MKNSAYIPDTGGEQVIMRPAIAQERFVTAPLACDAPYDPGNPSSCSGGNLHPYSPGRTADNLVDPTVWQ